MTSLTNRYCGYSLSQGDRMYNQLRVWVAQGIKQKEMTVLYQSAFNESIRYVFFLTCVHKQNIAPKYLTLLATLSN